MTPLSIFAAVTVLCTVLDIHVVQYSTVLYSTVLYSTVQYCTVLYYVQYCSTAIWRYLTWDRATLVALSLHYWGGGLGNSGNARKKMFFFN